MTSNHLLLYRLAELMLKYEQNILPVDLLFDDEQIGDFVKSIQIDSPYQQMLLEGVLTESVRKEKLFVSFTVEGYFHYVLGEVIYNQTNGKGSECLKKIVEDNKLNGAKEGVEQCLIRDVLVDDLTRLMWLIDAGEEMLELCVIPLLYSLKIQGVENTIEKLLENPTENDWKVSLELDNELYKLDLHILRRKFLHVILPINPMKTHYEVMIGIYCCQELNIDIAINYLNNIRLNNFKSNFNSEVLFNLGKLEEALGYYDNALDYYEKCLDIDIATFGNENKEIATLYDSIGSVFRKMGYPEKSLDFSIKSLNLSLKRYGEFHESVATSYNNIGLILLDLGNYDDALDNCLKSMDIYSKIYGEINMHIATSFNSIGNILCYKNDFDNALNYSLKSLSITSKIFGLEHKKVASSYINIGILYLYKSNYDKALEYSKNALTIYLKRYEEEHPDVATIFNNIGAIFKYKEEYDKSLFYYEKCLKTRLKILGKEHPNVAQSYKNIGTLWFEKGNYEKTMFYYNKSLNILLKRLGNEHPEVVISYHNIGMCLMKSNQYHLAIKNFLKGYKIDKKGGFPFQIAQCYEELNQSSEAQDYYIQSAEIRKVDIGIDDEATQEAIANAKRLAKALKKEKELPEWMK